MTLHLDRRLLLKAGVLGLGALPLPGAAAMLAARGFTHGVASGEPTASSVLLWTRFVAANDSKLRCEIATDDQFTSVVGGGEVQAHGERDHTAKLVVGGLAPGRWYHYRFIAPDGSKSPVGRTRTLPQGEVSRFGIGLFSCSNLGYGWFNAYAHAAGRDDLDLIVHVGDYLYEYGAGTYPSAKELVPGRLIQPDHEMVALADYRLRYAAYRADPDLQRLHQRFPMIAQWDDHEFTNDAWKDGAENHQPESEGDWAARKAAAERVYREWMPIADKRYDQFEIGSLATLFRLETRIEARDKQLDLGAALAGQADLTKTLNDFRAGPWSDPSRTLLGATQEKWLGDGLARSTRAGTRWQILAQQVIMGNLRFPLEATNWVSPNAPEKARQRAQAAVAASRAGLPFNLDAWDGYPAARGRLIRQAQESDANLVVLAGDSHNAWANNLSDGASKVGVEFAGHSVTSPGFEAYAPQVPAATIAAGLRAANPGLAFTDTSRRGYVSLELTPDQVTGAFHFLSGIKERATTLAETRRFSVQHGARVLQGA
ncbi:alkaline phosphatase D family protein [Allosphingosinicella deserti]|uniref:Alkaline phosphatase n=1 Tax=Allosphingosinicella deserti TaxID=2116704 RepID=A0A2P7QM37_9SPHN|nr:alkaline phosphatase D family protein [Sphingomonas deserti]PSJ39014.1 alkaline phosphatase [Sphingomonas deserti]